MDATTHAGSAKIAEALVLLEEAARERKDELAEQLAGKFKHLKEVVKGEEATVAASLHDLAARALERAQEVKAASVAKTKEVAKAVDESVHQNPWAYLAGAAAVGLAVGYLVGRRKS